MEPVAAGADEPRRGLVGPVSFAAGVVKRQDVDNVPGLVQRAEFLTEPEEVLVAVGGGGDRGLVGLQSAPVHDLGAHHPVGREREPRRDMGPAKVLNEPEAIRQRRRGNDPADRVGRTAIVATGGAKVMTFAWGVPALSGPASARCPESSKARAWRDPELAVKMLPDGPLGMAIADLLPVGGGGGYRFRTSGIRPS